jgi:hypothetical protein
MLEVTQWAPLQLEWAFEEPFDTDRHPSRHYVEDEYVNVNDDWYDEDDYDDFRDV